MCGGKAAPGEMPAELEPQKRARGVPGDTVVMAFGETADGAHERVGEVGSKVDVVVVDHDTHLLTDHGQPFHLGGDGLQPGGCVHLHVKEPSMLRNPPC